MNLSDVVTQGAKYFPEKKAVVYGNKAFTYRELDACVSVVASYFRELGISKGDRIALYAGNRPEWIMIYYGMIRLGAIAVCVSAAYKSFELEHILRDSEPVVLVTSESLLPNVPVSEKLPYIKDILIIEKDSTLSTLCEVRGSKVAPFKSINCAPDDTCVILYTGGTTGIPKGAMLTHKNLLYTAQNVCFHERTTSGDAGLCFMPLNHVFAGCHIMNSMFYACATLVLHKGFEMDEIISSIESNKVTRLYAVPTVYIRFLNNPHCHKHLKSVGYSFSAATSMPSEVVRQWKDKFGLNIYEAYGMTETSSLVTFNHLYRHKVGSVGTPAGLAEVKIADQDGNELGVGEEGEILIQGPNVMKGYFNRPEESAKAMDGGWLHSGDLGRMDEDGYLYIIDRIKDMVISGGLNVYPSEVEDVLYKHNAVEECGVAGLPDKEYGETVTAFVRLKKGRKATADELIKFCKERLASYKAPKRVIFMEDLPKTPQGKILKRELRKYKV
ncbi:MAG: long-chain-fatty-acid--CoA ligase [Deltaproteobacteria bacterium]|nr:long-chain-fatty-acid--CoA ligase [Deltaproteobacteria bacterium]MBW1934368.1 long-chain-fatty-acid--CoA ligase [Deltaproteobacteria bacterium]MBW1976512.1 long-chain-fatty-acid--CoA ligase [Deltaproteobacteria bacterium]MBW2043793.1 long-chain-fatty-acid--CoA ligase [Deltaproteobacteria bacterium]MBW2298691.1 long-chain-fatty-acid--CoA ligase [Deltaproteobacteria bacterium]